MKANDVDTTELKDPGYGSAVLPPEAIICMSSGEHRIFDIKKPLKAQVYPSFQQASKCGVHLETILLEYC